MKYTPAPGSISVSVKNIGDEVVVTVEDNGISPADLPHVFERFYRADPSRSQVEGSGLGLAIAKWIANVHHARLTVQSGEHEGSLFQVVFPVLVPSAQAAPDPRRGDAIGWAELSRYSNEIDKAVVDSFTEQG